MMTNPVSSKESSKEFKQQLKYLENDADYDENDDSDFSEEEDDDSWYAYIGTEKKKKNATKKKKAPPPKRNKKKKLSPRMHRLWTLRSLHHRARRLQRRSSHWCSTSCCKRGTAGSVRDKEEEYHDQGRCSLKFIKFLLG